MDFLRQRPLNGIRGDTNEVRPERNVAEYGCERAAGTLGLYRREFDSPGHSN